MTVIQKKRWWRETCGDMVRHWIETSPRKMGICRWSWGPAGTEWAALWIVVHYSSVFQSVPRASGHLGEGVDTWEMGGTSGRGDEGKKSGVADTLVQFSSVAQSCPTLCDPMNCSTPGLPVHHQLPEFTQTHAHRVGDAIQPSHPLSSPSPPAPNPSQHQGLFQWINSSHEVAKVLEFQLQHQSV